MQISEFWALIDAARQEAEGDPRKQNELLIDKLAQLSEDEIISFQNIFDDFMDEAYITNLWEAAYVIDCGCSDDGFSEFREWLIGRGQEVFYKTLADPETLIEIIQVGSGNMYPTMLGVAFEAYERVTGKDEFPLRTKPLAKLRGEFSSDDEGRKKKFPKLTEKYWNWWMKHYGMDDDSFSS